MDNKEQALALIKDVVNTLFDKSEQLLENILLQTRWSQQHQKFKETLSNLSPADRKWVETEYVEWFHRQNFERKT